MKALVKLRGCIMMVCACVVPKPRRQVFLYRCRFPTCKHQVRCIVRQANRLLVHDVDICVVISECPMLEPPCNGQLLDQPINPKPGDVVTYDCLMGFELIGEKTRTCQEDYTWDGKSPCCVWNPCLSMYI